MNQIRETELRPIAAADLLRKGYGGKTGEELKSEVE